MAIPFIPPLHLPDGYTTMGAPAPSLAIDGADKVYYGVQSKYKGAQYAYRVFLQPPSGIAELKATIDLPGGEIESGQGQLVETHGLLIAVAFDKPGDKQPISQPLIIDGYVPRTTTAPSKPTPIVVAADSPLWQLWRGMKTAPDGTRQPYVASDFDTDAEDAQRVGKQLAALNALIDALLEAGIIVKGTHTTFLPIVEK